MVAILALVVGLLGYGWAALGAWIGMGLFLGNLMLLHESGRALLATRTRRQGQAMAAGSSLGRFLFLAVGLGLIGVYLGREALLGACGGLLISQVTLHFSSCSSTEASG